MYSDRVQFFFYWKIYTEGAVSCCFMSTQKQIRISKHNEHEAAQ